MNTALVDIPVALIFFNRPDTFRKVFECVRKNKPSKLFLIQDGARESRPNDAAKVDECRQIASNVDWDCEVYRDFSEVNLGCGRRIFTGLQNAFKVVDRLVIIEDDIVFSDSFLPYCKELLERYKNDQRVHYISGMNHFGVYEDCNNSYFFSRGGAIWGWATWKRVWDEIDWSLSLSKDDYLIKTLRRNGYPRDYGNYLADKSQAISEMIDNGKSPSFWSFHALFYAYIQNRINIVPQKNLTSNIGMTEDAVHTTESYETLSKDWQSIVFAKTYELKFPLKHPNYLIDDRYYKEKQDELMYPTGYHKLRVWIELKIKKLKYSFKDK